MSYFKLSVVVLFKAFTVKGGKWDLQDPQVQQLYCYGKLIKGRFRV